MSARLAIRVSVQGYPTIISLGRVSLAEILVEEFLYCGEGDYVLLVVEVGVACIVLPVFRQGVKLQ